MSRPTFIPELPRIHIPRTPVNNEQHFAVHLRFMVVRYTVLNTALGRGGHRLANDRMIKDLLRGFFGRRAVRVVGVVALLVVVVVLLFLILNWYVDPTKPSERKDLVLAVAQILVGTVLLSGLYFTWRTLQVNREGQITDRFTRAIDQLGKVEDGQKLFEIRIGGIYALQRIARESEEDYWPIMEILTAYVRQNALRCRGEQARSVRMMRQMSSVPWKCPEESRRLPNLLLQIQTSKP
jgi:hypothetical protein